MKPIKHQLNKFKNLSALAAGALCMVLAPATSHAQITFDANIDESKIPEILHLTFWFFSEFWWLVALSIALFLLPQIIHMLITYFRIRRSSYDEGRRIYDGYLNSRMRRFYSFFSRD